MIENFFDYSYTKEIIGLGSTLLNFQIHPVASLKHK